MTYVGSIAHSAYWVAKGKPPLKLIIRGLTERSSVAHVHVGFPIMGLATYAGCGHVYMFTAAVSG